MLHRNLLNWSVEWGIAAEPFVGYHAKRVLITGRAWFPLELLGGHVGSRTGYILGLLRTRTLADGGNAEFSEQDLVVRADQHILRFDIAMDQLLRMHIP